MFSSDKNVNLIAGMLANAKKYGEMRLENFERGSVDKMTSVLTGIILGAVLMLFVILIIIFLSAAVVFGIAPYVGGYAIASLIVGLVHLTLLIVIWVNRKKWISIPINALLADVFLADKANEPAPTKQQMTELEQAIADDYSSLLSPATPANNRLEQAVNAASRAWSIADAVFLVYKLYNKFGGNTRKKRRK